MANRYSSIREAVDHLKNHFLPENAEGVDAVFQLDFTGDNGGTWFLTVQNQTLQITEGIHEKPSIAIKVSAEDWLGVINNGASPMGLFMQGKLQFDGDMGLALQMQNLFSRDRNAASG